MKKKVKALFLWKSWYDLVKKTGKISVLLYLQRAEKADVTTDWPVLLTDQCMDMYQEWPVLTFRKSFTPENGRELWYFHNWYIWWNYSISISKKISCKTNFQLLFPCYIQLLYRWHLGHCHVIPLAKCQLFLYVVYCKVYKVCFCL